MSAPTAFSPVTLIPASTALPISTKLLYGICEVPITVSMVLFGLMALFFYNSMMGLPYAKSPSVSASPYNLKGCSVRVVQQDLAGRKLESHA